MVTFLEWIGRFLFPPKCPGCGRLMEYDGQWCERCQVSFWNPRLIKAKDGVLEGCYALCNYDGAIRRIILELKFYGRKYDKRYFSSLLQEFPWEEALSTTSLVVPIPISDKKRQERGENQVNAMFQSWANEKGFTWCEALRKPVDIPLQATLSKKERLENIKGAFVYNPEVTVKGRSILLVDDIYTTGATMREAARILKKEKAATITGLVICSSH